MKGLKGFLKFHTHFQLLDMQKQWLLSLKNIFVQMIQHFSGILQIKVKF